MNLSFRSREAITFALNEIISCSWHFSSHVSDTSKTGIKRTSALGFSYEYGSTLSGENFKVGLKTLLGLYPGKKKLVSY